MNKQKLEAKQIINVLETLEKDPNAKPAWRNHPICKAWKGFVPALKLYYDVMLKEWVDRGYNNNMQPYYEFKFCNTTIKKLESYFIVFPSWLKDERVFASHRSNLLRKDPIFYGKYGWIEPNNLPYFWPV